MGLRYTQIDAFTDVAYRGNQAAVFLLPEPRDADWMQAVASELNLAETAYIVRREDGFALRWFTPAVEIDLAGHPTLASAHFLWESGELSPAATARFHTKSGLLTARRLEDGWIELDFPATPPEPVDAPAGLEAMLGAAVVWTGKSRFDLLVEVESEARLRAIEPDYAGLAKLPVRGVIVTARDDGGAYDFVSRFFAPQSGIFEDPVTGSAHCCLGPYWASKLGKARLLAHQASRRGGDVRVEVAGDRVRLAGQAVTTVRGELV